MREESFVAFRTLELRDLARALPSDEFKLYVLMSTYADGTTGRCWPGIPELMQQSGYSKGTVERARNGIERKGLISCIVRDRRNEYTGRVEPNVYEICGPLRLKNHAEPFPKTGGSVPSVKHDSLITRISNQNHLTRISEPESITSSSNQEAASRALTEKGAVPNGQSYTERSEGQRQQQNNGTAAQNTKGQGQQTKALPPGSADPSSPKKDFSAYQSPLADVDRERMAARISAETGCTTPIAREMAASYEAGQIEAALSEMRAAAQAGRIKKSPYGFTLWQLEHKTVSPEDATRARRAAALKKIESGHTFTDNETGQTCHFARRAGNQLTMLYDDGQHYSVSIDRAIDLYEQAGQSAAAGD